MYKGRPSKNPPLRWRVAFAKEWRDKQLCFAFHGASRWIVANVFGWMRNIYDNCQVKVEIMPDIVNGKCYRSVVAMIDNPDTKALAESEWPTMIIHFIKDVLGYDVTYFENYEKFLNT